MTFIISLMVVSSQSHEQQEVAFVRSLRTLYLSHQITRVIVYIEESNSMADVTFPSLPHVLSLLHYDHVARTPPSLHPPAGYPVACVTVSLKEHPPVLLCLYL